MNIFNKTGPQWGRAPKPSELADVSYDPNFPGFFKIGLKANFDPQMETQLGLLAGIMAVAESHSVRHYQVLERLTNPFGEAVDARFYLPNVLTVTPRFFDRNVLRDFITEFDSHTVRRMIAAIPEEYPEFRVFGEEVSIELVSDSMTTGHIGRNIVEVRARWQTGRRAADAGGSGVPGLFSAGDGPGTATEQSLPGTAVAEPPKGTMVARPAGLGQEPALFVDWNNDGSLTPIFEGDVVGRCGAGDPGVRAVMPWATASAKHFRVERGADGPFIRDANSRNGTIVQPGDGSGLITLTSGQTCPIRPGCRLGVSDRDGALRLATVTLAGSEAQQYSEGQQ